MPKINEILLKLEGFKDDVLIDLNMEYYHIQLSENSSNLSRIIIPWGKYHYKHFKLVVSNTPYIFQKRMNYLFQGLKCICVYIDNHLIFTKGDWKYHIKTGTYL